MLWHGAYIGFQPTHSINFPIIVFLDATGFNVHAPEFRPRQQKFHPPVMREETKVEPKSECDWIFSDDLSSIAHKSNSSSPPSKGEDGL